MRKNIDLLLGNLISKGKLPQALLWEKVDDAGSKCGMCQRRCVIKENDTGYCGTVANVGGVLYTLIYGVISSAASDPIEKKPVFHFMPSSSVFSIGTLGCNFKCKFCQNWQIAYSDAIEPNRHCQRDISPDAVVESAIENNCQGIAWTYNEPAIWVNYALDCAKLAKKSNLYTVYVTNGYSTPEALDLIAPYLDVYRVDIKSMNDDFYKKLIKVGSSQGIREVAERAKHKWDMHIECVTNIIPGWNDSDEEIKQMADWIIHKLGDDTPWHLTRFFPNAQMNDVPPTSPETLIRCVKTAKEQGLKFVYIGNIAIPLGENTYCPNCGKLNIERDIYTTKIVGLAPNGNCKYCGENLNIVI
ncbi:MAG: AmmeMemoRadiSam system radical SAM enzyme [Armatimonadota bacterium]